MSHGDLRYLLGSLAKQGWCSGESTRLSPVGPGVDVIYGMSLLVLVPALGFFSGFPPCSSKTNTSKFRFDWAERTDTFEQASKFLVLRG